MGEGGVGDAFWEWWVLLDVQLGALSSKGRPVCKFLYDKVNL